MKNLILAFSIITLFAQCHVDKDIVMPANPDTPAKEFIENPETMHYIVMSVADESLVPQEKEKMKKFNTENGFEKLRLSNIILNTKSSNDYIIVVRRFGNFTLAKNYISRVEENLDTGKLFAVTQENYRKLLRNRNLNEYEDFYKTIDSGE